MEHRMNGEDFFDGDGPSASVTWASIY